MLCGMLTTETGSSLPATKTLMISSRSSGRSERASSSVSSAPREFLAPVEVFKRLDRDGNGVVDSKEAEQRD